MCWCVSILIKDNSLIKIVFAADTNTMDEKIAYASTKLKNMFTNVHLVAKNWLILFFCWSFSSLRELSNAKKHVSLVSKKLGVC